MSDDAERLRYRQDDADDDATRTPGADDDGAPAIVGKTVAVGTYPTTAGAFYWITPQVVTGTDTEGSAGTLTAQGEKFLALNLGGAIPPAGTAVVCTSIAYRWVFRYD